MTTQASCSRAATFLHSHTAPEYTHCIYLHDPEAPGGLRRYICSLHGSRSGYETNEKSRCTHHAVIQTGERERTKERRERSGAWGVRGRGRGRGETSTVPPVRLRSLESRSPEMMIAMPVFCLGFVSPPPPNDTRHYASNQRRCRSLLRHPGS